MIFALVMADRRMRPIIKQELPPPQLRGTGISSMDEEGVDAELEVREKKKKVQAFALQGMHNSHSSANL